MVFHRLAPLTAVMAFAAFAGCSGAVPPPAQVAAASPPKDDGKYSEGSDDGSDEHSAALQKLIEAPLVTRADDQHSITMKFPDAGSWKSVKFWGVKSLFGYRYGKAHHALLAGFLVPSGDASPATCGAKADALIQPWKDAFELEITKSNFVDVPWTPAGGAALAPSGSQLTLVSFRAITATLLLRDEYIGTLALVPAWPNQCLVVAIAVSVRGDDGRAAQVRDRFVREVLPVLERTSSGPPPLLY